MMIMRRKNKNNKAQPGTNQHQKQKGNEASREQNDQNHPNEYQGERSQKAEKTAGHAEKTEKTAGNNNEQHKQMKEQEQQEQSHCRERQDCQEQSEQREQSDQDAQSASDHSLSDVLQKKVDELTDKHLRLYSEFDNYRKRSVREKADLLKSAAGELIKDILPLLDDMERALHTIPEQKTEERKGMELIHQKLKDLLKKKGLKEMDAMGKPFDTDYHEAITQIEAPEPQMKGKVVDVVEKGYFLHDKVLRYAKVVVGK